MREIKVRAWHEGRMWLDVQDAYDHIAGEQPDGTIVQASSFGTILQDEKWVVMQFTGRYDRNSREVYAGDILRNVEGFLAEVKAIPGGFLVEGTPITIRSHSFALVSGWHEFPITSALFTEFSGVVVGNIYENVDLMK